MRSDMPVDSGVTSEEDESAAGRQHQFCYCWWRSTPEFDERGRPDERLYPTTASGVAALTSRLRVLKEMERLALVSHDSLDDLRHKLLSYRAGDLWVPAGGLPKEGFNVPPVVTILLVGPAGAGKSSIVNLMYSVLGRSGLIPFARTCSGKTGGTRCLEEHNVLRSSRNGFCVYDSMGFLYERAVEGVEEVAGWMEDGVRHRQPCSSAIGPENDSWDAGLRLADPAARFERRRVNCVLVVANLAEIYGGLKAGDMRPLEATKALFCSPALRRSGEDPMLVLTHGDELPAEDRIDGRVRVCQSLGVREATGAYDIACLNEHGLLVEELDPVTAYSLAEAVYRALLAADRSHLPKRGVRERFVGALSWLLWSISAVFALLAFCFAKMAKRDRSKLKMI